MTTDRTVPSFDPDDFDFGAPLESESSEERVGDEEVPVEAYQHVVDDEAEEGPSALDVRAATVAMDDAEAEASHRLSFLVTSIRGDAKREDLISAWSVLEHDADLVFREGPELALFHACTRAFARDEVIDPFLIAREVLAEGVTVEAWKDWLRRGLDIDPARGDLVLHARTLLVRTLERGLGPLGAELAQAPATKREEVLSRIQALRERIESERGRVRESYDFARDMEAFAESMFDEDDKPKVETGMMLLDEFVGGLPLGYPTIVAARPGVGKTAFGVDLIAEFAARDELVYVLSVELDKRSMQRRLVASVGGIDHGLLIGAKCIMDCEDTKARALSTARQIAHWPIAIEAPSSASVGRVLADVRRAEADYGKPVRLVVIDHAQALEPPPLRDRKGTRVDEMREVSAAVRKLAKQLPDAATVLLWQLRRDSAQQRRAPMMSDLKGSSGSEQDADTILLLHRQPDDQPSDPDAPYAQIVVAKNRNGQCGVIVTPWCPHAMTWRKWPDEVPSLRLAGAGEALDASYYETQE